MENVINIPQFTDNDLGKDPTVKRALESVQNKIKSNNPNALNAPDIGKLLGNIPLLQRFITSNSNAPSSSSGSSTDTVSIENQPISLIDVFNELKSTEEIKKLVEMAQEPEVRAFFKKVAKEVEKSRSSGKSFHEALPGAITYAFSKNSGFFEGILESVYMEGIDKEELTGVMKLLSKVVPDGLGLSIITKIFSELRGGYLPWTVFAKWKAANGVSIKLMNYACLKQEVVSQGVLPSYVSFRKSSRNQNTHKSKVNNVEFINAAKQRTEATRRAAKGLASHYPFWISFLLFIGTLLFLAALLCAIYSVGISVLKDDTDIIDEDTDLKEKAVLIDAAILFVLGMTAKTTGTALYKGSKDRKTIQNQKALQNLPKDYKEEDLYDLLKAGSVWAMMSLFTKEQVEAEAKKGEVHTNTPFGSLLAEVVGLQKSTLADLKDKWVQALSLRSEAQRMQPEGASHVDENKEEKDKEEDKNNDPQVDNKGSTEEATLATEKAKKILRDKATLIQKKIVERFIKAAIEPHGIAPNPTSSN